MDLLQKPKNSQIYAQIFKNPEEDPDPDIIKYCAATDKNHLKVTFPRQHPPKTIDEAIKFLYRTYWITYPGISKIRRLLQLLKSNPTEEKLKTACFHFTDA